MRNVAICMISISSCILVFARLCDFGVQAASLQRQPSPTLGIRDALLHHIELDLSRGDLNG